MTTRHADAVESTLAALDLPPVHAAAVELARAYADELDGAAAWRARADRAVQTAREQLGDDSALYEEVTALRAKLSERTALAVIGKQQHALLAELLATPKARPAAAAPPASGGALSVLRGGAA